MATDDLIDDNASGGGSNAAASRATQPNTSISPEDISKAVREGLSEFGGDMRTYSAQMGQYVQQAINSAQQRVEAGNPTKEQKDLTQLLLTEPERAIGQVVQRIMSDQLGPYLRTKVQDDYESIVDSHRTRIDNEYGDGVFDELVLPDLQSVVDHTENKAAKAGKGYVATVVRGILGHEKVLPKLMEKKSAKLAQQKKAEMEASNGILDGGRRRGAKPNLSSDDINFLIHYESETDNKTDRKLLEEALAVRNRDGGWTVDNFPGLNKSE